LIEQETRLAPGFLLAACRIATAASSELHLRVMDDDAECVAPPVIALYNPRSAAKTN
jgi:hypothetical protein